MRRGIIAAVFGLIAGAFVFVGMTMMTVGIFNVSPLSFLLGAVVVAGGWVFWASIRDIR